MLIAEQKKHALPVRLLCISLSLIKRDFLFQYSTLLLYILTLFKRVKSQDVGKPAWLFLSLQYIFQFLIFL